MFDLRGRLVWQEEMNKLRTMIAVPSADGEQVIVDVEVEALDDGDSLNATASGGEPALASNPFNLRADRGLANYDVRNVAVISGVCT